MKRTTLILTVAIAAACLAFALGTALAADVHAGGKPTTLSGELVDMGCYIGHMAKGEKHADCAAKCVSGGMPMGVLTSSGKLYLLTMDHANPDAYNKAKDFAGKQVKITGPTHVRNGVNTIDVVSAETVAMAK
ncbi:MAG TPA: hypothetical protein VFM00_06565 [Candidatus Eisenbacteria bacterium]|jgi:hypothetical protein|nr:hypothetical protein [Candidatus Eisenbacteria bacterium]